MSLDRRPMLLGLLAVVLLASCSQKETRPVVSIQTVSPSGDVPLVAGDTVVFEVTARVQGAPTGGMVGLIVQGDDGSVVGECGAVRVSDGETVKLTAIAIIPLLSSVRIFVPLYLAGSDKSDIVDMRDFKVVGKKAG